MSMQSHFDYKEMQLYRTTPNLKKLNMNLNYLFAGTVSINPLLFLIQLFLVLAWRTAGWYGLDRYILPYLGTPWQAGKAFKK